MESWMEYSHDMANGTLRELRFTLAGTHRVDQHHPDPPRGCAARQSAAHILFGVGVCWKEALLLTRLHVT